mgnify:CR=1 FL=1
MSSLNSLLRLPGISHVLRIFSVLARIVAVLFVLFVIFCCFLCTSPARGGWVHYPSRAMKKQEEKKLLSFNLPFKS